MDSVPVTLAEIKVLLAERFPGMVETDGGLEVDVEWRYGRLTLVFDHDREAASVRIFTRLPAPPGGGPEFLNWCLSTNVLYWDVKFGLDAHGMLLVHADVDLEQASSEAMAEVLLCRIDAMSELIDEDFVAYIEGHGLATPAQRQRWAAWVGHESA